MHPIQASPAMPSRSPAARSQSPRTFITVLCLCVCLATVATQAAPLFSREWLKEVASKRSLGSSTGGGADCAACTIITDLLAQLSIIHDQSIEQVIDDVCNKYLPNEVAEVCDYLSNTYGQDLIRLIESGCNADEACAGLGMCTAYPQCHILPIPSNTKCHMGQLSERLSPVRAARQKQVVAKAVAKFPALASGEKFDPWAWLEAIFGAVGGHLPEVDIDHDKHSSMAELRGANWRGRDCADTDASVYPGRLGDASTHSRIDDNCNGISGQDPNTSKTWEDTYCSGTGAIGMAVVGDSAGAHFQIPPSYMNASQITESTYDNLFDLLLDEVDYPQRGGYTGFVPASKDLKFANSVYKYLAERNRCNHRDYQNCCVNGARSGATNSTIIQTLARNAQTDKPLLLFLELIGNDVCNGHHTLDTMTKPAEFEANILGILNYLDNGVLPPGSHVVFVGLADGLALWDNLYNRTHPIGVPYASVYDYLNCLNISPCWVWMNSNETVRNAGQARANELSAIYPKIIAQHKYQNFDMAYYDFPINAIAAQWVKDGGQGLWELIEPIDGFHPNQIANSLMADYFWTQLNKNQPHFIGGLNPNNAAIISRFGDQGGY